MARRALSWLLLLFTLALVGCDHATKVVAGALLLAVVTLGRARGEKLTVG